MFGILQKVLLQLIFSNSFNNSTSTNYFQQLQQLSSNYFNSSPTRPRTTLLQQHLYFQQLSNSTINNSFSNNSFYNMSLTNTVNASSTTLLTTSLHQELDHLIPSNPSSPSTPSPQAPPAAAPPSLCTVIFCYLCLAESVSCWSRTSLCLHIRIIT